MKTFTITIGNAIDGYKMKCRKVKRVKDAAGAVCENCGAVFMDDNSFWGWRKGRGLHENGTGHKTSLWAFVDLKQ